MGIVLIVGPPVYHQRRTAHIKMIDQHEKKIYERKSLADFHFVKVFWSIWLIVTTVLGPVSESGSELTMARIVALSGLSDLIYFLKHFEMHLI